MQQYELTFSVRQKKKKENFFVIRLSNCGIYSSHLTVIVFSSLFHILTPGRERSLLYQNFKQIISLFFFFFFFFLFVGQNEEPIRKIPDSTALYC